MNDNSRPLVIFGGGTFSSLFAHCLAHDRRRTVAAFTVDAAYVRHETHEGLPLVAFATLRHRFAPEAYDMFVAVGFSQMNALRHARCDQAMAMGYRLGSFVSSRASVWPDMPVGRNVIIFEQAALQC